MDRVRAIQNLVHIFKTRWKRKLTAESLLTTLDNAIPCIKLQGECKFNERNGFSLESRKAKRSGTRHVGIRCNYHQSIVWRRVVRRSAEASVLRTTLENFKPARRCTQSM